jgi:predicted transcriptional regulator
VRADGAVRRGAGELEGEVLAVLWVADEPLTPGQVQQSLSDPPAYNTILTVLLRLYEKGIVERHKVGRAHAYRTVVAPAQLAADRMHSMLGSGRDRTAVLQRFVAGLTREDESALRRLLGRARD